MRATVSVAPELVESRNVVAFTELEWMVTTDPDAVAVTPMAWRALSEFIADARLEGIELMVSPEVTEYVTVSLPPDRPASKTESAIESEVVLVPAITTSSSTLALTASVIDSVAPELVDCENVVMFEEVEEMATVGPADVAVTPIADKLLSELIAFLSPVAILVNVSEPPTV